MPADNRKKYMSIHFQIFLDLCAHFMPFRFIFFFSFFFFQISHVNATKNMFNVDKNVVRAILSIFIKHVHANFETDEIIF